MKRAVIPFYLFIALFSILFVLFASVILIPPQEIFSLLVRGAENQGLTIKCSEISRSFPLGISCRNLTVSESSPILSFDTAALSVDLLQLFYGRLALGLNATAGDGEIRASIVYGKKPGMEISAVRLDSSRIPYFKSAVGGEIKALFDVKGSFKGLLPVSEGKMTVSAKAVETRGLNISGIILPDSLYKSFTASFSLKGNRLEASSIALEGEGIYARLAGGIALSDQIYSSPLDFTLQLMPKPDFMEKQKLIFILLSKYAVSPGNYSIPVKGTLRNPSIM